MFMIYLHDKFQKSLKYTFFIHLFQFEKKCNVRLTFLALVSGVANSRAVTSVGTNAKTSMLADRTANSLVTILTHPAITTSSFYGRSLNILGNLDSLTPVEGLNEGHYYRYPYIIDCLK